MKDKKTLEPVAEVGLVSRRIKRMTDNGCFRSHCEVARLLLISKGKATPRGRQQTVLSAGKLLEKLSKPRISGAIHDFSPKQYDFKAGEFTIDAIENVVSDEESHIRDDSRIYSWNGPLKRLIR